MREEWKQIEAVLDEKVRPSLRAHGGELEIDHLEGGVLYIKLLGQCAGCPSADLTNETLIEHELTAALPELVQNCNKIIVMRDGKVEAAVDNSIPGKSRGRFSTAYQLWCCQDSSAVMAK